MDEMVSAILAHYDAAEESVRNQGREWYPAAAIVAEDMARATGYSAARCAAVISHLSPRTKWADNIHRAWLVLTTGTCPGLTRNRDGAVRALSAEGGHFDLLDTFGQGAHKTRAFFANIVGSHQLVTVDTWAARAAGVPDANLSNATTYALVSDAYREAAHQRGETARDMQAIVWCQVRGSAH